MVLIIGSLFLDRKAFTSILKGEEERIDDKEKEANCLENCVLSSAQEPSEVEANEAKRTKDVNQSIGESSTSQAYSICRDDSVDRPLLGNNCEDSSIQLDKSATLAYNQDVKSSTAQEETAEDPS